jgi:hypothetical protein
MLETILLAVGTLSMLIPATPSLATSQLAETLLDLLDETDREQASAAVALMHVFAANPSLPTGSIVDRLLKRMLVAGPEAHPAIARTLGQALAVHPDLAAPLLTPLEQQLVQGTIVVRTRAAGDL